MKVYFVLCLQCPIDMRVELSQNVLITGGTAMLPGFLHRVQLELRALLAEPRYTDALAIKKIKFHQPPSKANYTAWLGGKHCQLIRSNVYFSWCYGFG